MQARFARFGAIMQGRNIAAIEPNHWAAQNELSGKSLQNMMNANEVLIDILEDNRRRLHRGLSHMSAECVLWKPELDANTITITIWHMARILDVFLTQQAKGDSSGEECWFRYGWAERTGYDPCGTGQNGWGMLTGYTQEEVATMPELTREQVLDYLDEVYDTVKAYLANISAEELQTSGAGFDGRYTKYQCIQMALLDNVRHLGEIFAIEARWNRIVGYQEAHRRNNARENFH